MKVLKLTKRVLANCQRQMTLGINPEDILAYMLPHTQLVRQD